MKKCGLLGRKLGHSYSPQIHRMLGSYSYDLFEKEPENVGDFLRNGDFTGINVTIPYKKTVMESITEFSPQARRLGAVNTVLRREDGTLWGHNTDYAGFLNMLKFSGLQVSGKKVLVLGSGGASNTVQAVLEKEGASVVVISRSGENNYTNLHRHADAAVIVNTTPVGMYPEVGRSPVDLACFPALEGVLDLIYNPARTRLIMDARQRGIVAMNGLRMLVAQAEEASRYFAGVGPREALIGQIHSHLRRQMENYVLIGMPGCGKSTVARALAAAVGREDRLVDADARIEMLAGKTIPEIFAQDGEDAFRSLETRVLEDLGKQSGLIIATGGGCVTRQENFPLLRQNGILFWLRRDLDRLAREGRPLSRTTAMEDMYRVREPKYRAFADHIVDNNGSVEETVEQILEILGRLV